MRTGSVVMMIGRTFKDQFGRETPDSGLEVTIEYEIDAYGCRVRLHRDDAVYGPLSETEEAEAVVMAREDALSDQ